MKDKTKRAKAKSGEKDLGGRPTKFKPEYCEQLVDFFDIEPFEKMVAESAKEYYSTGEIKKESEKFKWMPNKMPTLYRFARSIKVAYSTVWRWAEKGEWDGEGESPPDEFVRFCNSYKEAKEIQKEFLINLGLAGVAPSPFAIFTAKNVTDMRDKQELEHTGKNGGPIETKTTMTLDEATGVYLDKIKG